ncbi:hypothetical protein BJP34_05850 [Moorena producens PAL-8-15-08-1]|uniref:Transposase n=1 Tax=Moorena producens PAL-8-15-08-1 TaxID=1458985 RepID=A0A1D8TN81_9CYAN|nr:hypothetical protein BJP34_05850 [Moorena producens PAL-8-15-08-1]
MKFISPKTDFAFKKIFGSDQSKDILISFLNAMIYSGNSVIQDLEIIDPYSAGDVVDLKDTVLMQSLMGETTAVAHGGDHASCSWGKPPRPHWLPKTALPPQDRAASLFRC